MKIIIRYGLGRLSAKRLRKIRVAQSSPLF